MSPELRGIFLTSKEPQLTTEFYRDVAELELEQIGNSEEYVKAEGEKRRVIKESEAKQQQQINEAQAILAIATATAEGLRRVGEALSGRGGMEAMQLRVAEEYVKQLGELADETSSTLIVPATQSVSRR